MITRASVTQNLSHWMYSPLKELLKVLASATGSGNSRPTHIVIDVNRRMDASNNPVAADAGYS